MNHFPKLKSFLKDGEAESYEGITIKYIHGRTAVLTISKDGVKQEEIVLHTLKTKEDMHALFKEKGFVQKADGTKTNDVAAERKTEEKKVGTGFKNPAITTKRGGGLGSEGKRPDPRRKKLRAKEGGLLMKNLPPPPPPPPGTTKAPLAERRKERKQRLEDERRYLGQSAPSGSKLMSMYAFVAIAVLLIASWTGLKRRRRRRAAGVR